jgi:Domain of unknown function (DUF6378)
MKAGEYCAQAGGLVSGDREAQHGDKLTNHANIAELWSAWLRQRGLIARESKVTAHDAAVMMTLLKLARTLAGNHNQDDYRDAIGYAAIAGQIADVVCAPPSDPP